MRRKPGELVVALVGIGLWIFASGGWRTVGIVLTFVGAVLAVLHVVYLRFMVREARLNEEYLAAHPEEAARVADLAMQIRRRDVEGPSTRPPDVSP
jgi:ABC-type molybdate transport system permease subunit